MSRILLVDAERRNWARRLKADGVGTSPPQVTRRYLLIVENPEFRRIIQREFSTYPNAVYPHETGKEDMFYCVAGPSCRRSKRMAQSVLYKLKKNAIFSENMENIEVIVA